MWMRMFQNVQQNEKSRPIFNGKNLNGHWLYQPTYFIFKNLYFDMFSNTFSKVNVSLKKPNSIKVTQSKHKSMVRNGKVIFVQ